MAFQAERPWHIAIDGKAIVPSVFTRTTGHPQKTHSILLHQIVAEDLCTLFDIVDSFRMSEFKCTEVIVEHLPPAECTFGKLVAGWIIGRPREDPVTRIAVVIHLAGLIALVLKFEAECDEHGGRM